MFRPTAIAGWRRSSVLQSIDSLLTDGRKESAGLIRSGQPIVVLVQEDPALRRALLGVGGPARPGVCRLTSSAIRSLRREPYGGVRPSRPLKRTEILYNSTLSIPERFGARTSDSSGTLLDPRVRFQRTA